MHTPDNMGQSLRLSVNPEIGSVLKGMVRHYSSSYSGYQSLVRRSLSIEDTLYTILDAKIVVSDLRSSLVQINEVDFC